MERDNFIKEIDKIHFIGVGGIGVSALAEYMLSLKKTVSGSDENKTNLTERLKDLGAKIYYAHKKDNVNGANYVCYTSAINEANEELLQAKKSGKRLLTRAQLLGKIVGEHTRSIGVSGSHGKTTTTAMITEILTNAQLFPTAFIGGLYKGKNLVVGKKDYCVFEACEYRNNFLQTKPSVAVVLNIDNDHMDSFKTESNLLFAFNSFIKNSLAVINADDERCSKLSCEKIITFGINKPADYTAKNLSKKGERYTFSVYKQGVLLGKTTLSVKGKHNVYNALASVVVADFLGVSFSVIKSALKNFNSVERRNEYLGKFFSCEFFADYAHHPSEIKQTLKIFSKNRTVVFQPHTFSRTKNLLSDFIRVLKDEKNLIIYKTYPAREKYDRYSNGKSLSKKLNDNGCSCEYISGKDKLKERLLKEKDKNKTVVFLGAGDIYEIAKNIKNKASRYLNK